MLGNIYFHIGPHKTGTTSVQRSFVWKNSPLALEGVNVLYDMRGPGPGHHNIARSAADLKNKASNDYATIDSVEDALDERPALLSSEEFSNFSENDVVALAKRFPRHKKQAIMAVRNQPDYLASQFIEASKKAAVGTPEGYVSKKLASDTHPDWHRLYQTWANTMPVSVIVYEQEPDMTVAVAREMGFVLTPASKRENVSLNVRFALVQQSILTHPHRVDPKVMKKIVSVASKKPIFTQKMATLNQAQIERVLSYYEHSNRALSDIVCLPDVYFTSGKQVEPWPPFDTTSDLINLLMETIAT